MTTLKTPIDGAKYFLSKGRPIFPLGYRTKVPPKDSTGLRDDSTTEPNKLNEWVRQYPGCNWGYCPAMGGETVIDLDNHASKNGEKALSDWLKEIGHTLPPTFTVRTPTGGKHLYFKGTLPKSRNGFKLGVDVHSAKAHVVMPGSIVEAGMYVIEDDRDPVELPAWFSAIYMESSKKPKTDTTGVGAPASSDDFSLVLERIATLPVIGKGSRDDRLFAIGCEWNDMGMGPAARLELFSLLNALEKIEQPKGDEITDDTFRRINDSIERTKKKKFGTETLAAKFGKKWVSAAEIANSDLPEPEVLIDGILGYGLCVLGGAPKLGKTNELLDMGVALATGGEFLGHKVEKPKRVLIGYLEGNEAQVKKRLALLNGPEFTAPNNLMFFFSMPPFDKGGIEAVRALIQDAQPDVIAFDVLQKVRCVNVPKGLNAYERDYREFDFIRREIIDAFGVSVILTHHTKKNGSSVPMSDTDILNGSSGIAGAVDTQLTLKGDPQLDNATLSVQGRDIEAKTLALVRRAPLGWDVSENGPILRPKGAEQTRLVELLKEHPDGLTAAEAAHALPDISGASIKTWLRRWAIENALDKVGTKFRLFRTEQVSDAET